MSFRGLWRPGHQTHFVYYYYYFLNREHFVQKKLFRVESQRIFFFTSPLERKRTASEKCVFDAKIGAMINFPSCIPLMEVVLNIFSVIPSQNAMSESRSESVGSVILPGVKVGVTRIPRHVTPTSEKLYPLDLRKLGGKAV